MVGVATRSMNSRRLGVNFISSGREATTAETERIPFLTGRAGLESSSASLLGVGCADVSSWWWVGMVTTGAGERLGEEAGGALWVE